jgi:hypothetical protein
MRAKARISFGRFAERLKSLLKESEKRVKFSIAKTAGAEARTYSVYVIGPAEAVPFLQGPFE